MGPTLLTFPYEDTYKTNKVVNKFGYQELQFSFHFTRETEIMAKYFCNFGNEAFLCDCILTFTPRISSQHISIPILNRRPV